MSQVGDTWVEVPLRIAGRTLNTRCLKSQVVWLQEAATRLDEVVQSTRRKKRSLSSEHVMMTAALTMAMEGVMLRQDLHHDLRRLEQRMAYLTDLETPQSSSPGSSEAHHEDPATTA